jgi:thioredoxin-related protein
MNTPRKILLSVVFALFILSSSLNLSAQQIAKPNPLNWHQDLDTAKKDALAHDKIVMLYFSGSDWCKPCIQLNKNILETETFAKYATGNFVPVRLDFPKMRKSRHSKTQLVYNESLAEKYNPNGVFPLLVFLDKNDKMIGFTGFSEVSPQAYVDLIDRIIHQ